MQIAQWISKNRKLFILTVCLVVILAVVSTTAGIVISATNDQNKIIGGVYVNDTYVGSMTEQEAKKAVESKYGGELGKKDISVVISGKKATLNSETVDARYDAEKSVNKALKVGREGNFFKKVYEIVNACIFKKHITPSIKVDEEKLNAFITENADGLETFVVDYTSELVESNIVITNGTSGMMVNREKALEKITNAFENSLSEVILDIEKIEPSYPNAEDIYKLYDRQMQDATFEEADGEVKIYDEVIGVKVDKANTAYTIEKNREEGKSYSIPVEIQLPNVKADTLKKTLFKDVLSEFKTNYSSSSANRASNIELAASKINGTVLKPGEEFSFNTIVGKRTTESGFKTAHAYSSGKVIDEVGGGICQVSSTLYTAVLYADLQVTERRSHQMTVSYVPLGQDATVNYGTQDFKFKNNSNYPIKILANGRNRTLTVKILGYKEESKYTIRLINVKTATYPFKTVETVDNTLAPGKVVVDQNGSDGYKVESFRAYYEGDKLATKQSLGVSNYNASDKIVRKGPDTADVDTSTNEGEHTDIDSSGSVEVSPEDEVKPEEDEVVV